MIYSFFYRKKCFLWFISGLLCLFTTSLFSQGLKETPVSTSPGRLAITDSSEIKKAGEAFLRENKNKPGVISLPSGLQYQVIKEGDGPRPTIEDRVKVHYRGTLIDGTVFCNTIERGQPGIVSLNAVLSGWAEALQLMHVGSKWKLFIPSNLGYGDNPAGPLIKPGSTLIFEVQLLEIVKS